MDKKAVMYGVMALVILLIIALVIKPLATGQPVNIGLPSSPAPKSTSDLSASSSGTSSYTGSKSIPSQSPTPVQISTTISTPVPTWNAQVKSVDFVDPATYGLSRNQTYPNSTRVDSIPQYVNMTTFATFSGKTSGTTQIMYIPFPYWELWYTVDPMADRKVTTISVTPAKGEYGSGVSSSDISGSYTTVKPQFTLQVMDANDPNRIVRVITPPGGIDLDLWLGVKPTTASSSILKSKPSTDYAPSEKLSDPRPWKEKFFEGQKDYYFVIDAQSLKSYKIDIRVPQKYIGKY